MLNDHDAGDYNHDHDDEPTYRGIFLCNRCHTTAKRSLEHQLQPPVVIAMKILNTTITTQQTQMGLRSPWTLQDIGQVPSNWGSHRRTSHGCPPCGHHWSGRGGYCWEIYLIIWSQFLWIHEAHKGRPRSSSIYLSLYSGSSPGEVKVAGDGGKPVEHLHLVGQLHLAQPEEVIMMSMRMIMMMQEKNLVKSDCEEENRFGLLTPPCFPLKMNHFL